MQQTNTRDNFRKLLTTAALAAAATFSASRSANGVPVNGAYVEDPRCDTIPNQTLTHELGQVGFFPLNEALQIGSSPATFTVCVPDDGIANDWIVTISNISGTAWRDLFFVADLGIKIGNSDGSVHDLVGAPNVLSDAFRIDGTVTLGLNNNLINESGVADEILSPGEQWRFNVSNFAGPVGTPPFPVIIQTPGVFAGSSPIVIPPNNTASILAVPIPEPSTLAAFAIPAAAWLMSRRPRR